MREMEEELSVAVPCSSLAVESILRVATAGALWGFCAGPHDARKLGLSGMPQALHVVKLVGKFSFQCAVVSGVFSLTQCGLQRYRRKSDWVNALTAGAVAGAAIAVKTRNWNQVIGTAGLVSAFSVAADYYQSN